MFLFLNLQEKPTAKVPDTPPSATSSASQSNRIFATPLARTLASEHGVALASVAGSGPDGQIRKDDVLKFVSTPTPEAAAPSATPSKGVHVS